MIIHKVVRFFTVVRLLCLLFLFGQAAISFANDLFNSAWGNWIFYNLFGIIGLTALVVFDSMIFYVLRRVLKRWEKTLIVNLNLFYPLGCFIAIAAMDISKTKPVPEIFILLTMFFISWLTMLFSFAIERYKPDKNMTKPFADPIDFH